MGYFAAEALVRRARSLEEVVKERVLAYDRDASSVLADVIFQCADDKYDGGPRDVVSSLMERSRHSSQQASANYAAAYARS